MILNSSAAAGRGFGAHHNDLRGRFQSFPHMV
jgi:hypothetical protein